MRWIAMAFWMLAGASVPAFAQDSKAWLESQGLEAVDTKSFNEFEAVVARATAGGEQRAIIFGKAGKPQ